MKDIILSDDETEEDVQGDDDRSLGGENSDDAAAVHENEKNKTSSTETAPEELLKTKKIKRARPFNEDLLCGDEGLLRVYEEFPIGCKFKTESRGSESAYLRRLITMYKEWAFQLHPGIAFSDVLHKCESLGVKSKVRGLLEKLRERERERYVVSVLDE